MNAFIIDSKGLLRERYPTSFPNTYLAEGCFKFCCFLFLKGCQYQILEHFRKAAE